MVHAMEAGDKTGVEGRCVDAGHARDGGDAYESHRSHRWPPARDADVERAQEPADTAPAGRMPHGDVRREWRGRSSGSGLRLSESDRRRWRHRADTDRP